MNKKKSIEQNKIEKIIDILCENVYNKEYFLNEIKYLNLKTDDRITNNKRWLIFYDAIDPNMVEDYKRNGGYWVINPQISVNHIYVAFHFNNNVIRAIHIKFRNFGQYQFSASYIKEKFKDIINKNNKNIEIYGRNNYPIISNTENEYSIFITYQKDEDADSKRTLRKGEKLKVMSEFIMYYETDISKHNIYKLFNGDIVSFDGYYSNDKNVYIIKTKDGITGLCPAKQLEEY
ncbi:MAG: hypothetical protein LBQ88_06680 [Treponema sp.]|nr:hypothetical protein [Treponema sp.]